MQPTLAAELAAVRATVESLAGDSRLPGDIARELTAVAHTVAGLERSAPRRLPYLIGDNQRMVSLLGEIRSRAPGDLAARIDGAVDAPRPSPEDAEERNVELRALLTDLLASPAAPALAGPVAECLRAGIADRPW